jgi:tRNA (mo5U34)-methyltransferase
MGFRGVRMGGVAVLIDVDDEIAERLHRTLGWARSKTVAEPLGVPAVAGSVSPRGTDASLEQAIARVEWYHTIDLGNGIVTPGSFDHRPYLDDFRVPDRLDGMRALDVATFDGYWAFEFEKRGASEVVAIDLDRYGDVDLAPRVRRRLSAEQLGEKLGAGFAIAHRILGSKVRRQRLNVYELSPDRLGMFDFVFCSDLLLHLQNPMRALENIRRVTAQRALIVDTFHPLLPHKTIKYQGGAEKSVWWFFSLGALEQMIRDAGFDRVELVSQFQMRLADGSPLLQAVFDARP